MIDRKRGKDKQTRNRERGGERERKRDTFIEGESRQNHREK